MLRQEECAEVAKPEWWNDEELKALSERVVEAAPNHVSTNLMRAHVLRGLGDKLWELGPRSGVDIMEAAACFERAAAMSTAPAGKSENAELARVCRDFVSGAVV